MDEKTDRDRANEVLLYKEVLSAASTGDAVEMDPNEADTLGAFRETALDVEDL